MHIQGGGVAYQLRAYLSRRAWVLYKRKPAMPDSKGTPLANRCHYPYRLTLGAPGGGDIDIAGRFLGCVVVVEYISCITGYILHMCRIVSQPGVRA